MAIWHVIFVVTVVMSLLDYIPALQIFNARVISPFLL